MKSLASLSLILCAASLPATAQEPPAGTGPRGSSQPAPGEVRYDAVGLAGAGTSAGFSAASAALAAGDHAEVTALDSGRTIVVAILLGEVAPNRVVMLSADAVQALGLTGDGAAVRVRKVTPTPQDVAQLRAGTAASPRADAPPALLVALRKKLVVPQSVAAAIAPAPKAPVKTRTQVVPDTRPKPQPKPVAVPEPSRPSATGYVVQVAALSSAARAAAVARAVGGTVIAGPPVWRIRLGPYPDAGAAARAKADAARKGYPGGQITRLP